MIEEILNIKNIKMTIIMDSNNLVESLKSSHSVQEKRLRVDLAARKKGVVDGVFKIRHCIGCRQVADVLTKSGGSSNLIRKVMTEGSLREVMEAQK